LHKSKKAACHPQKNLKEACLGWGAIGCLCIISLDTNSQVCTNRPEQIPGELLQHAGYDGSSVSHSDKIEALVQKESLPGPAEDHSPADAESCQKAISRKQSDSACGRAPGLRLDANFNRQALEFNL
jgi:hypothetical protein